MFTNFLDIYVIVWFGRPFNYLGALVIYIHMIDIGNIIYKKHAQLQGHTGQNVNGAGQT